MIYTARFNAEFCGASWVVRATGEAPFGCAEDQKGASAAPLLKGKLYVDLFHLGTGERPCDEKTNCFFHEMVSCAFSDCTVSKQQDRASYEIRHHCWRRFEEGLNVLKRIFEGKVLISPSNTNCEAPCMRAKVVPVAATN